MKCKKCGKKISPHKAVKEWDESASYHSTKLLRCPDCNDVIAILKYSNEIELDINNDIRYYTYITSK
jgi:uncharacterized Zn finger protein